MEADRYLVGVSIQFAETDLVEGVARLTNEVQFLYDRELQWEQNIATSI